MKSRQSQLWMDARSVIADSLDFTRASLEVYGPRYEHWSIAWSGGKDSSCLLTVVLYLIESGQIKAPKRLTVCYADTRMELLPLAFAAQQIIDRLKARGVEVRIVMAPLDERFYVYMFGRGVPPPSNTFRWCTPQIKVEPMEAELHRLAGQSGQKILVLTGVRQGESAVRDGRIAMSCGKDGAECGQGWYQETLPESLCDTLAPILHWRVCHVWDWLRLMAPRPAYGSWPTAVIADAYGGEEAVEINARTGCVGCPLASVDMALDVILQDPDWSYLQPLKRLKPLYRELKEPRHRLRKAGGERRKDGQLSKNQNRMGPLTMVARRYGMGCILAIQDECNDSADRLERPRVDLLNIAEVIRIKELIAANTWPDKWTGEEPVADQPFDEWDATGAKQSALFGY